MYDREIAATTRLLRAWRRVRTRLLWGPRLFDLGRRAVLGRPLACNHPGAVVLGDDVRILDGFALLDLAPRRDGRPRIVIGGGTVILAGFRCCAAEFVRIGRDVRIGSGVLIADCDDAHRDPVPVLIEDRCRIGHGAAILRGVLVGHDAVIGAAAVVTADVPPGSVVPARVRRPAAAAASSGPR